MIYHNIFKHPTIIGCIKHTISDEWSNIFLDISMNKLPKDIYIDSGYMFLKDKCSDFSRDGINININDFKKLHDDIYNFLIMNCRNIRPTETKEFYNIQKTLMTNDIGNDSNDESSIFYFYNKLSSEISEIPVNSQVNLMKNILYTISFLSIYNSQLSASDLSVTDNKFKINKVIPIKNIKKGSIVEDNDKKKKSITNIWLKQHTKKSSTAI